VFSVPRVIFLLLLVLVMGCLAFWQYRRTKLTPFTFCFVLYLVGVLCAVAAILPGAGSIPGGAEGRMPLLVLGFALIAAAWFWHLYMSKFRPHQLGTDTRTYLVMGVCGVILLWVYAFFSEARGLIRWVQYVGAAAVTLIGLCAAVCWRVSLSRDKEIIRLIEAEEYGSAIAFGESVPENERTSSLKVNLGAAYFLAGRADDARRMFDALAADPNLPGQLRTVVQGWQDRIGGADAGEGAPGADSIPVSGAEAGAADDLG